MLGRQFIFAQVTGDGVFAAPGFVAHGTRNLDDMRRERRRVDKATGLRSDQPLVRAGPKSSRLDPEPLRRVAFYDV